MVVNEKRAALLRDQVMKTWTPPAIFGKESPADIAQTAVMQTLAWVFGKEYLGPLTYSQNESIDQGLTLFAGVFPDAPTDPPPPFREPNQSARSGMGIKDVE